jgi:hypothetical protein
MKRIPLRTLSDPSFQPGSADFAANVIVWADVIKQVIRRPLDQQKGADIEELRKGIRVLDAVDKSDGKVLALEDADYEHLKEKTHAMPWAMVDRRILQFIDDVDNAGENLLLNDSLALADGQVKETVGV